MRIQGVLDDIEMIEEPTDDQISELKDIQERISTCEAGMSLSVKYNHSQDPLHVGQILFFIIEDVIFTLFFCHLQISIAT